jgi:hypothetical protein
LGNITTLVKRFRVQRSGLRTPQTPHIKGLCLHRVYKADSPTGVCRVCRILINMVSRVHRL